MGAKSREKAFIIRQEEIANGIFSMWLKADDIVKDAKAGQFITVYSRDGSRILPRPISICELDKGDGALRIVYRVAGRGTEEFAVMRAGMIIDIMGPLGNGFPKKSRKALVVGGGIGIPPMLELTKELRCEKQVVLGFRDDLFLTEEFEGLAEFYIATEDGSAGVRGTVLDAIRVNELEADIIYACGPKPMLKALKAYAAEKKMECWVSLEERMACGVGACLACVCASRHRDEHTNVRNKRVCKEGPVFRAEEVEL